LSTKLKNKKKIEKYYKKTFLLIDFNFSLILVFLVLFY